MLILIIVMITERNCNGYDDSKVFIPILLIPFFIFLFSYFSRCCKRLPVGCITPRESNQPTPMQLADFTYCHVDRKPFPNNSNNCLFFHRDKKTWERYQASYLYMLQQYHKHSQINEEITKKITNEVRKWHKPGECLLNAAASYMLWLLPRDQLLTICKLARWISQENGPACRVCLMHYGLFSVIACLAVCRMSLLFLCNLWLSLRIL